MKVIRVPNLDLKLDLYLLFDGCFILVVSEKAAAMFCRVQPKTKLFRWRSHDHHGYYAVVSRCACAVRLIDYDPLGLTAIVSRKGRNVLFSVVHRQIDPLERVASS